MSSNQYDPFSNFGGVSISTHTGKPKKTVKFDEKNLEKYKYFKLDDEPNAPGLTSEEVEKIQRHLENVPQHQIPSELKKFDLLNDRKIIEE